MSDYPPGTVAVATVHGVPNVRVMSTTGRDWWSAEPVAGFRVHRTARLTDIRPLVVLDLGVNGPTFLAANLKLAARRADEDGLPNTARDLDSIADQIEAQAKPPKPEEPQGLGAVVEDSDGERWVHVRRDASRDWCHESMTRSKWATIDAVKVLSEGVQ